MSTEATPLTAEEEARLRAFATTSPPTHRILWTEDVARLLATLDRERAEHAALREKARLLALHIHGGADQRVLDTEAWEVRALTGDPFAVAALDEVKG